MNSRAFPSLVVLVAANLLPVAGVLFWGWKVGDVIWLYWLENLVIGAFNALCMLLYGDVPSATAPPVQRVGIKLFLTGFFLVHYGGFCMIHGLFIADLFPLVSRELDDWARLIESVAALTHESLGAMAVLAIVASHAFSFVRDEVVLGRSRGRQVAHLMFRPYLRIVAIHLFLLAGGLLIQVMHSPVAALMVFVVVKIVLDATLYLVQQRVPGEGRA
jgi:hypothetical protein